MTHYILIPIQARSFQHNGMAIVCIIVFITRKIYGYGALFSPRTNFMLMLQHFFFLCWDILTVLSICAHRIGHDDMADDSNCTIQLWGSVNLPALMRYDASKM